MQTPVNCGVTRYARNQNQALDAKNGKKSVLQIHAIGTQDSQRSEKRQSFARLVSIVETCGHERGKHHEVEN
jgi:hypothetical protein